MARYDRRGLLGSTHSGRRRPPFHFLRCAMNNRQSRLTAAARNSVGWVLNFKKATPRVTQAAKRLQEALDAASAAEAKQRHAKGSRKAPRYSISEAKTILLKKHLHPIAADGLEMFA